MHDAVAVAIREEPGNVSCHLVDRREFQRTFLTAEFFDGIHEGFLGSIRRSGNAAAPNVPTTVGYVLFDFTDKTIVSWQTAASVDSVPRSRLADIYEENAMNGAAIARAITHRNNMGEGDRPAGPFNGDERDEICGYTNIHERFSTYHFTIPGWTCHVGLLTAQSCEEAFLKIESRIDLSDQERSAWVAQIQVIRNAGSFADGRREAV